MLRFLVFSLCLSPVIAYGESTVWPHLGVTHSTMTNIPDEAGVTVKGRTAASLGLAIENSALPVLFGISYTQKGTSAVGTGDDDFLFGNIGGGWRLGYLEVSALGKLGTPLGMKTEGYLLFGGYGGLQTDCELMITIEDATIDLPCDSPDVEMDHRNKNRFGLVVGAGASQQVRGVRVALGLTYAFDLTSMSLDDEKSKHRTLGARLGIGIPFGSQ